MSLAGALAGVADRALAGTGAADRPDRPPPARAPVTFAAFAEGLLSVDQVAVVARRAPVHNDREACDLARAATVAQLRVGLSKHFLVHPDPPEDPHGTIPPAAPKPEAEHRVTAGFDDDGDFFLHGLTNGMDGAVILQALSEAKDGLFRAGNTDVTWLDALVEVCKRSLGSVGSPSRRDLFTIIVHLDTDGAWVHHGPAVPPALLDRLTCDATIQPLWTTEGLPVNLGRRRRIVPTQTRLVVEDRDRICRHPTCTSSAHLEVHHLVHWAHGGATDTGNLACLCSRHHHAHHRGEFAVTGDANRADGLTFSDRRGQVIHGCATPQPPGDRPPPRPANTYAHPTGERLQLRWLSFTGPPVPRATSTN
ncbi:MAG: hypothetical protein JWM12_2520 [Ilumatobacteraceae bacterium]|nr:hypothetical protein [Ilumatobacteraceae bacterium]